MFLIYAIVAEIDFSKAVNGKGKHEIGVLLPCFVLKPGTQVPKLCNFDQNTYPATVQ